MNTKIKQALSRLRPRAKGIIFVSAVFLIVIAAASIIGGSKESELTTIAKASLQELVEISELSTVDYTYNAVAKKTNEKDEIMYYVAYEGVVTAGIDFKKLEFSANDKEKKLTVYIPEIEIQDTKVDMGTMEYIFTKDKYETESISQEAYKLCKDDLISRIDSENVLYETARENAQSAIEGFLKPWFDALDDSYTIEFK